MSERDDKDDRVVSSSRQAGLQELIRLGERHLDYQYRMMEQQARKSERMLAIGLSVLGGGLALAAFAFESGFAASDSFVIMGLAWGVIFSAVSLMIFLEAYLVMSGEVFITVGPGPRWLAQRAQDNDLTLLELSEEVIVGLAAYAESNANVLEGNAGLRRRGAKVLLVAALGYTSAIIFMLLVVM